MRTATPTFDTVRLGANPSKLGPFQESKIPRAHLGLLSTALLNLAILHRHLWTWELVCWFMGDHELTGWTESAGNTTPEPPTESGKDFPHLSQ